MVSRVAALGNFRTDTRGRARGNFDFCNAVTRKQAIGWPVEENFALRQFENNDGGFISAHLTISATESLVISRRLQ